MLPAAEDVVEPEVPVVPETPKKQSNFTDVKPGAYYETPVQWAVENGITSGTSATEFSPNMTCSQAHILTFLWRSVDKPASDMASPYSNANVTQDKYYYTPFVWAWEKGMVGNTKHDPNAPCSRADVVSYLWKLEGKPAAAKSNFTDVSANAEYADAVAWAVANGITSGTSKTTFSPNDTCTRGQIVSFLYRYVNGK
ncbi:MAG: S-layer homology domain-containing protein [Anaerotignum sp.]|nr:S-layer homology domain-containing protein [Anaerotignum sp.]